MIRRFRLRIKVLTPLHIGTGQKLTEDFDYVCRNGRTYRLNPDALVAELYTQDPKLTEQLLRTPPGQLLKPEDLRPDAPYIRYVLEGTPSGKEFREAIKDPQDRPYIPGSSLKGALRTVIAWHAWNELRLSLAQVRLGSKEQSAAKDLEAEIFGRNPQKGTPDPHYDILRALRIADSNVQPISFVKIYNVKVWTPRGGGVPISVEAIKPGAEFFFEATFDETLFSEWAGKARGFPFKHHDWLEKLPELARERARERMTREQQRWQGTSADIVKFCDDVLRALGKTQIAFPLQLGFGTGWDGTTIGVPLKKDPLWPKVYYHYNELGKSPRTGRKTPPDEFPRSRRVVVDPQGRPTAPLGWIWVQWKEVS